MSDSRRKHLPPTPRAKRKTKGDTRPERRPDLRTTKQRRAADKAALRKET